jgi:peptide/nickel transport system permease protein
MSEASLALAPEAEPQEEETRRPGTFSRLARYSITRLLMLFITVVIGVYLTILIANMGGYVDEIRDKIIEERIAIEEKRMGLDQPFILRSFGFLKDALTLNLGFAEDMFSDTGSRQVKLILLERLPSTLVLWGLANLFLFFISLFAALFLSRRYGSVIDRVIITMAPTGSAPAWFYGLFLILIFAALLQVLPFGTMVDAPPPDNPVDYALSLAKHLILPVTSILISSFFLTTYNWRTFFLIYSSEDYVEMAKAKGLSDRAIERRYILRPTLPTIITNFALLLITLWTGAIILETVFNWPGLGRALYQAIGLYDTPVIVGSTVIYAYLLALTVFSLDFIYAAVDPRVRIGSEGTHS